MKLIKTNEIAIVKNHNGFTIINVILDTTTTDETPIVEATIKTIPPDGTATTLPGKIFFTFSKRNLVMKSRNV